MADAPSELSDAVLHEALDELEGALELIHLDPPAPDWVCEDPPELGIALCTYVTAQRVTTADGRQSFLSCGADHTVCDYLSHAVYRARQGWDVVTLDPCPVHRGRLLGLCRHCAVGVSEGQVASPWELVGGYVAAPPLPLSWPGRVQSTRGRRPRRSTGRR